MKHAATGAIAHQPLALTNARLVDPVRETQERGGVLVIDGVIRDLGPRSSPRRCRRMPRSSIAPAMSSRRD